MLGLLSIILGAAASAWGDKQQRNRLQRIADKMQAASDKVRGDVSAGYDLAKGYLTTGYDDAETALIQGFEKAQEQLEAGNDEAATQILKGLGLATDEINKWADVAAEGMEWVVDFGKEGIIPARAYLAEMSEAIMNPDAIWQSDVYLKYKSEVMDSMKNALSGSPGLMSGNTWAAMQDRLGKDAMAVRNNQIASLQAGYSTEANRIGMGMDASKFIGSLRQAQGANLANLYTGAYNQLGVNERDLASALSGLSTSEASGLANLATGQGQDLANLGIGQTTDLANIDLGLATQLANIKLAGMQENPWTNLGTTATTLGSQMIGNKYGGGATAGQISLGGSTGESGMEVDIGTGVPVKGVNLTSNLGQQYYGQPYGLVDAARATQSPYGYG